MLRPVKQFCVSAAATKERIRKRATLYSSIQNNYWQWLFDFDQISKCSIFSTNKAGHGRKQGESDVGLALIIVITYMTTWLGDKYQGEHKQGWNHGYGRLEMENGIVYEGQFVKGQFHGEGKLIYPNGGYYKAQWVEGKMTAGQYIFNDNLSFEKEGWKHCVNDDRRFYQEYLHGIKPSGATQQTREDKPHNIPTGTYDTGDGYYEPVKSIVYSYDGKIHRTPTEEEVKFILEKCRYVPKAVDIDGSKDRVIKKILEIETKK